METGGRSTPAADLAAAAGGDLEEGEPRGSLPRCSPPGELAEAGGVETAAAGLATAAGLDTVAAGLGGNRRARGWRLRRSGVPCCSWRVGRPRRPRPSSRRLRLRVDCRRESLSPGERDLELEGLGDLLRDRLVAACTTGSSSATGGSWSPK